MTSVPNARQALQSRLFPTGIPRLWCPTLTYFSGPRTLDEHQIRKHLHKLAPHIKGILVPGSTGEGWEMNDTEVRNLLEVVLAAAEVEQMGVLVGVLKTEVDPMLVALDTLQDLLQHPCVKGVTVCAARGAELSQQQITDGFRRILERGQPTALYQLPQITKNEISPESFARLVAEFPNLILFKDTSGEDRVASSGIDFDGVFLMRGSEQGGYAKWLRAANGPYDGFLLSTANVFAAELMQLIQLQGNGQLESAAKLSGQLESYVSAAFNAVSGCSIGNPFTNANKVMEHVLTYGASSLSREAPKLYSGARLPAEAIQRMLSSTVQSVERLSSIVQKCKTPQNN